MDNRKVILITGVGLLVALFIYFSPNSFHEAPHSSTPSFHLAEVIKKRPDPTKHIFDFAGKMKYGAESRETQPVHFEEKYGVEAVTVTVPDIEGRPIKDVAAEMFSNWKIGKRSGEKGLLLLVAFKEQEVKLEVGYGAEAVFTDLFCGYIERMALQPFFKERNFSDGLSAIWEHFIARAENTLTEKEMKEYLNSQAKYFSGGAGIKDQFEFSSGVKSSPIPPELKKKFVPQSTPEALVEKFREMNDVCVSFSELEMSAEASRAMGHRVASGPPSRLQCDNGARAIAGPYEILREGEHAVAVFYTSPKAQPLMMELGPGGWQADILAMRQYAQMDHSNNAYIIDARDFPYRFAFQDKYADMVKGGRYAFEYGKLSKVTQDYEKHLSELEDQIEKNPEDVDALLRAAELYIDLTVRQRAADTLEKVIKIAPDEALAYKYMAYLQRDWFASPREAISFFEKYIKLRPKDQKIYLRKAHTHTYLGEYIKAAECVEKYCAGDEGSVWCNNQIGYYYYKGKNKTEAKKYFQMVLKTKPENEYAQKYLRKIGQ